MWILPKNHSLHLDFATDVVGSITDLKEELDHFGTHTVTKKQIGPVEFSNMPLTWRSKQLPPTIWLRKWSKVYWLPLLFGRTLKHFPGKIFTKRYTSSLVDILANHFHKPGYRPESQTQDIYSPSLNMESTQLDLFSASLKMSPTTSISDTEKSDKEYQALVTKLRRTYSLRSKWARRILESGYSSSLWPTPTVLNRVRDEETLQKCLVYRNNKANQTTVPLYLEETIRKWATPQARDFKGETGYQNQPCLPNQVNLWATPTIKGNNNRSELSEKAGDGLMTQAKQWTTPSSRDWKDTQGMKMQRSDGKTRLDQLPRQVFGQHPKDENNLNGNTLVLNPAWVSQLMGSTLQQTFFAWKETPSLSNRQNSPSERCCQNLCCCENNPDADSPLDIVHASNCCPIHNQKPYPCQLNVLQDERS